MIPKVEKKFLEDFAIALEPINIRAGEKINLWMNDEVMQCFTSDFGDFELSIDIWDCAFVMSKSAQRVIRKIDDLLQSNDLFEKEEINFEDYQKNNTVVKTSEQNPNDKFSEFVVEKPWWKFWKR